eukprot:m.51275 g.51275  ORF g.51275 m.51275 type:complete len:90 (+) comp11227_c0_seq7:2133-2402(+)
MSIHPNIPQLVKISQIEEFKSVTKFRVFNTNNLWINLRAIKRVYDQETLRMEIIENTKVCAVVMIFSVFVSVCTVFFFVTLSQPSCSHC